MASTWYKFHGGEYLIDPKIKGMTAGERSCWITLMCYSSTSECEGVIKHLTESQLIRDSGIGIYDDQYKELEGILQKFERLEMITVDSNGTILLTNWNKKQEKNLTGAERMKRYRLRRGDENEQESDEDVTDVTESDATVTLEEKRIEKKRIEENINILYELYISKIQPRAKLLDVGKQKVRSRLKIFSVDELKRAIDHFSADQWWMEHNGNKGFAWFFNSDGRIEQFINLKPRPGKPKAEII